MKGGGVGIVDSRDEENSAAESKKQTGSKPSTVSMSHFGSIGSDPLAMSVCVHYTVHLSVLILGPFHFQAIAISV